MKPLLINGYDVSAWYKCKYDIEENVEAGRNILCRNEERNENVIHENVLSERNGIF
jgi:hypothetical protein